MATVSGAPCFTFSPRFKCNMEALNNIEILHLLNAAVIENVPPPRRYLPRVVRIRDDPFTLPDYEFKRHFCLTKASVRRLAELLQLQVGPRPGRPLTDLQKLCIALHHFGSKNFIRTSANCGKVSYCAAWNAITVVRDALLELAPCIIWLPTDAEAQQTAARMEQRYGLPGFAYGVDGMIVFFDHKVMGLPRGPGLANANSFHTRKGRYGLNGMFIANDRKLIHALDVEWHGSAHDARAATDRGSAPVSSGRRLWLSDLRGADNAIQRARKTGRSAQKSLQHPALWSAHTDDRECVC